MVDANAMQTGFDIDAANLLAKDLGLKLVVVPVTGPTRVQFLRTNKVDLIMASFSITDERKKVIDFSEPYGVVPVVVGGPEAAQIKGPQDLSGKAIAVTRGTTSDKIITDSTYGAEHLLTCRAATPAVGQKLVDIIDWWKDLCQRNNASLDNNPSSGNKKGGLTTVLEKSLGGVAKGGTTGMMEVYQYAEPVEAKGLVFMNTPGYDPMSATGQLAGGTKMICFTTGRGSAFGCAPAPSLKLSTNTELWNRQQDDIDMNCGTVVDEGADIGELGRQFYELMIRCASGERSKSETYGYGQNEFVPWQLSVVT